MVTFLERNLHVGYIKYASTENTPFGKKKVLKFINAAMIAEASYIEEDGTLILLLGNRPGGAGQELRLTGEEAQQALAVLQRI